MFLEAIGRNANNFDVALREIGGAAGDLPKLSGAHRCEVSRMREQDGLRSCQGMWDGKPTYASYPRVTNPIMEFDGSGGGQGLKVGRGVSETKGRHFDAKDWQKM